MAIFKSDTVIDINESLDKFKPKEVVELLSQYIIGQEKAKRLVALALRNRIRRKFVPAELQEEIAPKNILMIGPTGVGKTEIARRIAQLVDAPFIKVEATKFTERGYVGRDVESMIRALVNHSVNLVKARMREAVKKDVDPEVTKTLQRAVWKELVDSGELNDIEMTPADKRRERAAIAKRIANGEYDGLIVSVKLKKRPTSIFPMVEMFPGMDDMDTNIQNLFGDTGIETEERKLLPIAEAREALTQQYMDERVDKDKAIEIGIRWAQEMGIIFIDEMDKISDKAGGHGPDVSREGVQRDLLPIVEGTSVNTKYGVVKTDHMLFIAAGAFHVSKPSDMIPELQGRFPIRVELDSLSINDLKRILIEPKNSLVKQYTALLNTEGVNLNFDDDAFAKIVEIAYDINSNVEDIGARRLHTIMEYLLEEISFNAPDMKDKNVNITSAYVEDRLSSISKDRDITRYIL
jgi:ATP-dependent HslUV protease ATP-binding subunit HslU